MVHGVYHIVTLEMEAYTHRSVSVGRTRFCVTVYCQLRVQLD